ncbi:15994_t:CDS:2 [Cetraspora pellucida]|uniref:15994_t:CDS:1 n=1 Tax=Cetraspora pellucida TaxID=1433469 RepID=A0A9N9FYA7_9GLOM|nr:15994_t:CDS:2 [Cetraspora pellucida]
MPENLETTRQEIVDINSVVSGYHSEASDIFDKDLQALRELARKSMERIKDISSKSSSQDEELHEGPKTQSNIAILESMATLLGLESFAPVIADYYVTVFIDNRIARKTMESGGKRPWQKEIMREVPSQLNPADELTRLFDETDWTLSQELFEFIDQNQFYYPGTEAVDCFTQNWENENNYICSLLGLLHKVFKQSMQCKATITLITPVWPSAPWWPILLQQRIKVIDLPHATKSFLPSQCGNLPSEPWKNPNWKFQAIKIYF